MQYSINHRREKYQNMAVETEEFNSFNQFFREDVKEADSFLKEENTNHIADNVGTISKEILPKITTGIEVTEDEVNNQWQVIRSFFRNANNQHELPKGLVPVILSPLYTANLIEGDYPIWFEGDNESSNNDSCIPWVDLLKTSIKEISEKTDAHILYENVERIVQIATKVLENKPNLLENVSDKIFNTLEDQLEVSGDEVKAFKESLIQLKSLLPKCGILMPYTSNSSLQLLDAAMVSVHNKSRKQLKFDISQIKCRLKDMLRVEGEKSPNETQANKAKDSYSFAQMVDFEKVTSLSPNTGSELMTEERKERISITVEQIEVVEKVIDKKGVIVVEGELFNSSLFDWNSLFENYEIIEVANGDCCNRIREEFEKNISEWTKLITCLRVGELDFKNDYRSNIHDDYFNHFNWQNFTSKELSDCPHFILIANDNSLFDKELSKLNKIYEENLPIKVVAIRNSSNNSAKADIHSQSEFSAMMMTHKNIFVGQSTSITPKMMFNMYQNGISSFTPSFFSILNIDKTETYSQYLMCSAAVESRDFPGFTFNGVLGSSWGSRFNVSNNPQPNNVWPIHQLAIINEEGEKCTLEFTFTFADKAVLNSSYTNHFMFVNSSYWNENLIPLADYIENSVENNIGKVPFIWMMDSSYKLQRVAVSWDMVIATQERKDFWKYLQENSGVNNYHVNIAIEKTKEELREEFEKELDELKLQQEKEIQKVREEESGKVMENLTSILLNLDTTSIVTSNITTSNSNSSTSNEQLESTANQNDEVVEEVNNQTVLSNEPYIDTALCTSCNECINMNGQLFKYNGDKMAYIADPKAGTFNQLVEAAELCPVSIIHPGTPLNSNEPDLDSLIERAAKFN